MKLLPSHHTTMHYVTSCEGACVFSCNLPPAPLEKWPRSFKSLSATAVARGWNGCTKVRLRVSTESWPWRRKFSCRSCRDSDLWPFSHEFSTQTAELSPCVLILKACWPRSVHFVDYPERTKHIWQWLNSVGSAGAGKVCGISSVHALRWYRVMDLHIFVSHSRTTKACQSHWHQENTFCFGTVFPMFDGCHTHLKCDNAYICICMTVGYTICVLSLLLNKLD